MSVLLNRANAARIAAAVAAGTDLNGKKIHSPSSDEVIAGLTASSEMSKKLGHPGPDIRPCMAQLMESALDAKQYPDRSRATVALASELRRIGTNHIDAIRLLEDWNWHHKPPLSPGKFGHAIENGFGKGYTYSCDHSILQAYCIGRDSCPFVNRVRSQKGRFNDLKFADYGWPQHLTTRQTLLYTFGIPHFERTRQVGRGGLVYATHRQLSEVCGFPRRRLNDDLRALAVVGLIEYVTGTPRMWEGKASEIRRVFPVPHPTAGRLASLKKSKHPTEDAEGSSSLPASR